MRKITSAPKKETKKETRPKRRAITGKLTFTVGENEFFLELTGKVSQSGKTVVFRSSKDDYLEQGVGCNIWVDLDLI